MEKSDNMKKKKYHMKKVRQTSELPQILDKL